MASDAHVPGYVPNPNYTQEDWDDVHSPELTDEQLAQGQPLREAMPELVEAVRRRRGPQKAPTKEQIALRVDRDTLEGFRAAGPGWQGRMNALLWLAADIGENPGVDTFDIVPGRDPQERQAEEAGAEVRRSVRAAGVQRALYVLHRRVEEGRATQADAEHVGDLINSLRGLRVSELDLLQEVIKEAKAE